MAGKTLLDGFGEATEQVIALRSEVRRLRAALREIALVDLSGDGGADLCMCHTLQAVAKEALAKPEGAGTV